MNTLISSTCRQLSRRLNRSCICALKPSPITSQEACFITTPAVWFHPRISNIPESTHQALRKQFNLSDDYFVIYKEPQQELSAMVYAKCFELFLYGTPLWGVCYAYFNDTPLATFVGQDKFFIGMGVVSVYLLGIRFFLNGFVKAIFHNRTTDVYRAFVLNRYMPTYKFVDFKANEVNVINLPPSIPMARNFFRAGKQTLILHDKLFTCLNDQEKLIGEALEQWHAKWKK